MLVIFVFDMETSALRSSFRYLDTPWPQNMDIWIYATLSTAFVQFLHVYLGASVIVNLSVLWRCSPSLMVGRPFAQNMLNCHVLVSLVFVTSSLCCCLNDVIIY
ncbi:hypothetical protein VPH35_139800 [Triticum aestivum]